MREKPRSKPGRHGTLYRYTIVYDDPNDPGFGESTWSTWAYDQEHALDRFLDTDVGYRPLRIARQTEAPQHRWTWHRLDRALPLYSR